MRRFIVGLAAAVFAVAGQAYGDNLIVNGSFEVGPAVPVPGYLTLPDGNSSINSWIVKAPVTGGSIDLVTIYWQQTDGRRSLDLNGLRRGGIAQSFATTPGHLYDVSFMMAGNSQLLQGQHYSFLMNVTAAGQTGNFAFDSFGHSYVNMGWEQRSWWFIAGGTSTELWFYQVDTQHPAFGPALDKVEVFDRGAVPELSVFTFYNNSSWDNNDGSANAADDGAIATDKVALLPGETATFANYTSYDKGINGLMIDVLGLPGTPTLNDFLFRMGNDSEPYGEDLDDPADDWPWAPDPIAITMRPGEGQDGADRVTLIWEDGAIRNCWLQVTVLATDATGLVENEVFYVGNAVAESGSSTTDALVNAADEIGARNNPHTPFTPAPKDDAYDYNRDKLVNATDQIIARNNRTNPFTPPLRLITPPLEGR